MSNNKSFNPREMMIVAGSRLVNDYELAFVGVGISCLAGMLAKNIHAPNATIIYEGGGVGAETKRIPWSIADNPTTDNALMASELWRVIGDVQRGYIDVAVVGGAQIDKYGNVNTSVIFKGENDFIHPGIRLAGPGGATDLASCCKRFIILSVLDDKRSFVEKVDYISSPGFISGPGDREKYHLPGSGPFAVVTDKCIFKFHPETKEMYIASMYPGISPEEVQAQVAWDIQVSENLDIIPLPTEQELTLIKTLDPMGFATNPNSKLAGSFDDYYVQIKASYSR